MQERHSRNPTHSSLDRTAAFGSVVDTFSAFAALDLVRKVVDKLDNNFNFAGDHSRCRS